MSQSVTCHRFMKGCGATEDILCSREECRYAGAWDLHEVPDDSARIPVRAWNSVRSRSALLLPSHQPLGVSFLPDNGDCGNQAVLQDKGELEWGLAVSKRSVLGSVLPVP